MSEFTLFQQLISEKAKSAAQSNSQSHESQTKIAYQRYEIMVNNNTKQIDIPLRETQQFETALSELDQSLTEEILKLLLRRFRGVRGK